MKTMFDPAYPEEQQTAEFWEQVRLDAMCEWVLRQMDAGRIEPPPNDQTRHEESALQLSENMALSFSDGQIHLSLR